LFTGYELLHSQPETDTRNCKLYGDVQSEASEFSETTKLEQKAEAGSASSKNSFSETGLFGSIVPKQDPSSDSGNQEDSVSLPQSVIKPQDIHVPVVPKHDNLETAVFTVKDVKSTKMEMKRKQTVCNKVKNNDVFWVHLFYHIRKL
jgi:hypothetical protein